MPNDNVWSEKPQGHQAGNPSWYRRTEGVTPATVDPALPLLPTHEMDPGPFEQLLRTVGEEVEGLRRVQTYGDGGQAQYGLDLVGSTVTGEAVGIQGKRYQKFTLSDLNKAVKKYTDAAKAKRAGHSNHGFIVERLIIGVSCLAQETKVVEKLRDFNKAHAPLQIELWDRRRLSDMLRPRPDIVRSFFGEATASSFCLPSRAPVVIPSLAPQRADVADAVRRGPEKGTGASARLAKAARLMATDPLASVTEYAAAERLLQDGLFPAHAVKYTYQRARALALGGMLHEAVDVLSDLFWDSVRQGNIGEARHVARQLNDSVSGRPHSGAEVRARLSPAGRCTGEPAPHADAPAVSASADGMAQAATVAVELLTLGPAGLGSAAELLGGDIPLRVSATLGVLAAEVALAEHRLDWLAGERERLDRLAADLECDYEPEAVRLRLCLADASGSWTSLLLMAHKRRLPRGLCALIMARHARHLALSDKWEEAREAWDEAVELACLDGHNAEATGWQRSLRLLRRRTAAPGLTTGDDTREEARLIHALENLQFGDPLIAYGRENRQRGVEHMLDGDVLSAIQDLRGHLRAMVASASWEDEQETRCLLAKAYTAAGHLEDAAQHLISAGEAKVLRERHAVHAGERFLDITNRIGPAPYWQRASAFELLAAQADLLPDYKVGAVSTAALEVLNAVAVGKLRDSPLFGPVLDVAAHKVLAALAERLTGEDARRLLNHLRPLAPRSTDSYRHTDDAHAAACARIAMTFPELRDDALDQLVQLIEGETHDALRHAQPVIRLHGEHIRPQLTRLADAGNHIAAQLLLLLAEQHDPDEQQLARARSAARRLAAPSTNTANDISFGTPAVSDSLLARLLPAEERITLIHAQLDLVRAPYELVWDRRDYLIAASNLAEGLSPADNDAVFAEAMILVRDTTPSDADRILQPDALQIQSTTIDIRSAALLLAASTARTDDQRELVRRQAFTLLVQQPTAAPFVVDTLHALRPENLGELATLLATHPEWAIRALGAQAWVHDIGVDDDLGPTLAHDSDARVRRALAQGLAGQPVTPRIRPVYDILVGDVRYSVRRLLASGAAAG
ncbi:hypothetical protein [Micromonospora tulbaghiae]|uniref:hypothetical protein n=1 Tax=Micromonospora tulbaghiae TaxID=479978 RepID=UPI003441AAE3